MINQKELFSIITVTLVLGILVSLVESFEIFIVTIFSIFIIILINTITKKIVSYSLDTDIEIKIWELNRWGYKTHHRFKSFIQAGIFIPILIKFFTMGLLNWMACLTFDASGKVYRAARRHGIYSFSEVTEAQMGWIAGAGIITNIIFSIIAYTLGFETFAKLSLTYAFFNMIPIYDLDGAKIFFGSITFWSFLAIISSLGMLSTFMF